MLFREILNASNLLSQFPSSKLLLVFSNNEQASVSTDNMIAELAVYFHDKTERAMGFGGASQRRCVEHKTGKSAELSSEGEGNSWVGPQMSTNPHQNCSCHFLYSNKCPIISYATTTQNSRHAKTPPFLCSPKFQHASSIRVP